METQQPFQVKLTAEGALEVRVGEGEGVLVLTVARTVVVHSADEALLLVAAGALRQTLATVLVDRHVLDVQHAALMVAFGAVLSRVRVAEAERLTFTQAPGSA